MAKYIDADKLKDILRGIAIKNARKGAWQVVFELSDIVKIIDEMPRIEREVQNNDKS